MFIANKIIVAHKFSLPSAEARAFVVGNSKQILTGSQLPMNLKARLAKPSSCLQAAVSSLTLKSTHLFAALIRSRRRRWKLHCVQLDATWCCWFLKVLNLNRSCYVLRAALTAVWLSGLSCKVKVEKSLAGLMQLQLVCLLSFCLLSSLTRSVRLLACLPTLLEPSTRSNRKPESHCIIAGCSSTHSSIPISSVSANFPLQALNSSSSSYAPSSSTRDNWYY